MKLADFRFGHTVYRGSPLTQPLDAPFPQFLLSHAALNTVYLSSIGAFDRMATAAYFVSSSGKANSYTPFKDK